MPRVKVPGFLSRSNASHRKGAKHRTALLATVALLAGMIPAALVFNAASAGADGGAPTIQSDFADYNPGQTVTLTGANWDSAGSPVHIVVNDSDGYTWQHTADVSPAAVGTIQDIFKLSTSFISHYSVEASQLAADGTTTLRASSSFTDANPSASLDQCANDPVPSSNTDGCSAAASDWVNGNLGASKAVYLEGDSIPYRMTFGSLSLSSHTVTIEWDTTKSGTHALDYLTTFNRTVATANPCLGVSPCNSPTTFPIPADPQVTGAGVTPAAGNFTFYGGTITSVSSYTYADGPGFVGDKSARITLTFTATQANPVLAWGGHISSRHDWGSGNSAINISGSPYHTRLIDLDGSGGNQDRSLSAEAVIFPGSITVIKDATPNGPTSFGFTGSPAPLTNFSLVDDGTSANTKSFSNITSFVTYSVNESSIPSGWGFDSVSCSVTNANGGSYTTSTTTANIVMKEGEDWTCTYLDSRRVGTLTVIKQVVNDNGGTATAADWSLHVKSGTSDVTDSPQPGSTTGTKYTLTGGAYNVSETGGPAGYALTGISGDCDASGNVTVVVGQDKTCTLTNDDIAPKLIVIKHVINDNGGTAVAKDFTLDSGGTNDSPDDFAGAEAPGTTVTLDAGSYNVTESGPTGYSASFSTDCTGTIAVGQTKTCTVTNNDQAGTLIVIKHVINDNGGTAQAKDFTLDSGGTNDSPDDFPGAESPGTTVTLDAGSYNVAESGPAGYAASFSTDCFGTIAVGQTKTCTVTNDDIAPALHLRKVVVNDNGGTKTVADFTLTANGAGTNDLSGTSPVDSGAGLKADTWALSETNVYGYSASAWVCVGGSQSGSNISLAVGQSATCTITNDDQPGTIVIKKITKPANTGSFGFTTTGTGYNGFTLPGGGQNSQTLNAGTYTVKEGTQLGWILTGIGQDPADPNAPYSCAVTGSGGSTGVGDLNTQTATITLKIGDTVTCTFENTGQGVTRTQGFWATHTPLANIAWFGGTAFGHTFPGVAGTAGIGDRTICGRPIDTLGKLMGGFWSDVSKTSTGAKRSALDQARMQLLQQLLSAELNASAFGSVPSGGSGVFATWEAAYCGTNQTAIKNALQAAASFNTQGDSSTFTPGTSADSKNARAIATVTFWDVLP